MKTLLMHSDSELVAAAKEGNGLAFRQLVQRHEPLVRSTVTGMLGRGPDAEDVAQEVFIRFFKALADYRGDSQLSTYLCRIAINLSLNALKRRHRRFLWVAGNPGHDAPDLPDPSNDPARRDTQEWVRQAIKSLEPDFRTVVVLRMIDGYSVRETAEILDLPEGTVASRLARAQKKLKELLGKWDG